MNGNGRLYLIAALIGLPPMLVLLTALAPGFTARARAAMQERARLSLMLGGINLAFFFGLGLLIEVGFAPIEIVAVLSLIGVLPILLLTGLMIAAGVSGERIWRQITGRPGSLLGSLIVGDAILGLAALVPVLGWFLALGMIAAGVGAGIIALTQRKNTPENTAEAGLTED